MYHIGVRTGLFTRKIKVIDHSYGPVLNYATLDQRAVFIPIDRVKKFVVFPDYWQHLRDQEQSQMAKVDPVQDVMELNSQLRDALEKTQSEVQQLLKEARIPKTPVIQVSPQRVADNLMDEEIVRRARERANNAIQQTLYQPG